MQEKILAYQCFHLTAAKSCDVAIAFIHHRGSSKTKDVQLSYSFEYDAPPEWKPLPVSYPRNEELIVIPAGCTMYIRGTENRFSVSESDYYSFKIYGDITVGGFVYSLLNEKAQRTLTTSSLFTKLFYVTDGSNLFGSVDVSSIDLSKDWFVTMIQREARKMSTDDYSAMKETRRLETISKFNKSCQESANWLFGKKN